MDLDFRAYQMSLKTLNRICNDQYSILNIVALCMSYMLFVLRCILLEIGFCQLMFSVVVFLRGWGEGVTTNIIFSSHYRSFNM